MRVKHTVFFGFCLIFFHALCAAQEPELVVQTGHSNQVLAVCFSPDGKLLATGSVDKTAKIWDIKTSKELRTLRGHQDEVKSLAFNSAGTLLASSGGYYDRAVRIWNIEDGKQLVALKHADGDSSFTFSGEDFHTSMVSSLAFQPLHPNILATAGDQTVKIWDIASRTQVKTFRQGAGHINSITFSRDGSLLASGASDSSVTVWNFKTGREIRKFCSLSGRKHSVALSKNNKWLACTAGEAICVYDIATGEKKVAIKSHYAACVAFSPDDSSLACSGSAGTSLIRLSTGTSTFDLPPTSAAEALAFSPDGELLVTAAGEITTWDAHSGNEIRSVPSTVRSPVWSLAFDQGDSLLVSFTDDLKIWDITTAKLIRVLEGSYPMAIAPNWKMMVHGNLDSTLTFVDFNSGVIIRTLAAHPFRVKNVAFNHDCTMLASIGIGDSTVKIWDLQTFKLANDIHVNSWVYSVAFSMDDKFLAFTTSPTDSDIVNIYDLRSESITRRFPISWRGMKYAWAESPLLFSHSGKILSTIGQSSIQFWDPNTGELLRTIKGQMPFTFSKDDRFLAYCNKEGNVELFDVNAGEVTRTFSGRNEAFDYLAFSSRGDLLATGGLEPKISLREVSSGKELVSMIAADAVDNSLFSQIHSSNSGISQLSQKDYAVVTNDHYYRATKGGLKGIAFRIANRALPVEQFDAQFNRPDIVLERLGHAPKDLIEAYHQAYEKRLKKLGFDETMFDKEFHLPEVSILTSHLPLITKERFLKFRVRAEDSKYLLERLYISINDVPIHGSRGIDLRDRKSSLYEHAESVELSTGRNKAQISVLNEKGIESLRETFEVIYDGISPKPDLYLVSIGVSRYDDTLYNLKYADKDAEALARFFKPDTDRFGNILPTNAFRRDNLGSVIEVTLLNDKATLENIRNAKKVLLKSKPDDHVILFFAGHGILDDSLNYYLATTDMNFDRPSERGLPYDALEDLLDGIPARNKILLVDACHSGEIDKEDLKPWIPVNADSGVVQGRVVGRKRGVERDDVPHLGLQNSFDLMNDLFADLRRSCGAVVIASAGGLEYSLESSRWGHGVFTFSLLEAFDAANSRFSWGVNWKAVSTIRDYVLSRVQDLTKGEQKPTVRRENLEFDFNIW